MVHLVRNFFRLWARTGKGLGWLYQKVDQFEPWFYDQKVKTKILGKYQIECDLRDHIQRQIYFFGAYEPIETHLLGCLLQSDDVVVDAGGNIGFYTLWMASRLQNGKVHCFEPVPSNFERLKHNISLNQLTQNVVLNQKGLWDQTETLVFSLETDMENNIGSFTAGEVQGTIRQVSCPVIALDEYASRFLKLDMIKMDIEGAERRALLGAQKIIDQHRPQFLIEINRKACQRFNYDPQELAFFFKQRNYDFYLIGDTVEHSRWIDDFRQIEQANVLVVNEKRKHLVPQNWQAKVIKNYFISQQY